MYDKGSVMVNEYLRYGNLLVSLLVCCSLVFYLVHQCLQMISQLVYARLLVDLVLVTSEDISGTGQQAPGSQLAAYCCASHPGW